MTGVVVVTTRSHGGWGHMPLWLSIPLGGLLIIAMVLLCVISVLLIRDMWRDGL